MSTRPRADAPQEATATRLLDLAALLRRRKLLFAVLLVVCVDGVLAGVLLRPAQYVSIVTVTVAPPPPMAPNYRYIAAYEVAREARDIFLSQAVAEKAGTVVGRSAGQIRADTTAVAGEGWQSIELRYTAHDAAEARATADASANAGIEVAKSVLPKNSTLKRVGTASAGVRVRLGALLLLAATGVAVLLALLGTVLIDMRWPRR